VGFPLSGQARVSAAIRGLFCPPLVPSSAPFVRLARPFVGSVDEALALIGHINASLRI